MATVLLIEDDAATREAYGELVRRFLGYEVVEASNGAEALELLANGVRPSVIVLDLWMPTMDGFTFRQVHRSNPNLPQCPVIVCSASGDDPAAGLKLDATVCLQKPTDPHVLLAMIELLCGGTARAVA